MKGTRGNVYGKRKALETVFLYLHAERVYLRRRVCHRYVDERALRGSISLDRRGGNAGYDCHCSVCAGPIAVNGAIVVGYKLAKIPGVLVSVAGTILPPFLILSLISLFYDAFADNIWVSTVLDGMQAGVAALIAAVVWDMSAGVVREHNALDIMVMIAAFALNQFFGVNVVIIIFACIVIGVIRSIAGRKKVSA